MRYFTAALSFIWRKPQNGRLIFLWNKKIGASEACSDVVRVTGLEPVRHETHAPQTCLSASSSTLAFLVSVVYYSKGRVLCHNVKWWIQKRQKNNPSPRRKRVLFIKLFNFYLLAGRAVYATPAADHSAAEDFPTDQTRFTAMSIDL